MANDQAKGDAARTGMPVTPSAKTFVAGPDIISQPRVGGGAYGENGYTGASSVPVNKQPISPMAASLKAAQEGTSPAVERARAIRGGDDWQTRDLRSKSDKNREPSPIHPSMKRRGVADGSPGATVPATTGASVFNPNSIRKPGA
jgi:hypothetical protein